MVPVYIMGIYKRVKMAIDRTLSDFMSIKAKKSSFSGSNKIYTFCLNCGEVVSIRIDNPEKFQ